MKFQVIYRLLHNVKTIASYTKSYIYVDRISARCRIEWKFTRMETFVESVCMRVRMCVCECAGF